MHASLGVTSDADLLWYPLHVCLCSCGALSWQEPKGILPSYTPSEMVGQAGPNEDTPYNENYFVGTPQQYCICVFWRQGALIVPSVCHPTASQILCFLQVNRNCREDKAVALPSVLRKENAWSASCRAGRMSLMDFVFACGKKKSYTGARVPTAFIQARWRSGRGQKAVKAFCFKNFSELRQPLLIILLKSSYNSV